MKKKRDKVKNISKCLVRKRMFLNKIGQSDNVGSIEINRDININYTKNCIERSWPEAYLRIADCSRSIELHFDLNNKKQMNNSIYKINKLSYLVNKFKNILLKEIKYMQLMKKKYPGKTTNIHRGSRVRL